MRVCVCDGEPRWMHEVCMCAQKDTYTHSLTHTHAHTHTHTPMGRSGMRLMSTFGLDWAIPISKIADAKFW